MFLHDLASQKIQPFYGATDKVWNDIGDEENLEVVSNEKNHWKSIMWRK